MRAICVDDEEASLRSALSLCREAPRIEKAEGFSDPEEALAWVERHPTDLVLLDIRMPGTDGIALAQRIRELSPRTAIVFLTAHPEYALRAWELHASGYLLKPLTAALLCEELDNAAEWLRRSGREDPIPHIAARSFGSFDLYVDGRRLDFSRAKARELLAYLIDRKGIRASREECFRILWPNEEYARPGQKQLDVVIRSLRSTLREYGIGELLVLERGTLRIVPRALDCDMYRLFAGDERYENEYRGEYMSSYAWANQTEGMIDSELRRRRSLRGGKT